MATDAHNATCCQSTPSRLSKSKHLANATNNSSIWADSSCGRRDTDDEYDDDYYDDDNDDDDDGDDGEEDKDDDDANNAFRIGLRQPI